MSRNDHEGPVKAYRNLDFLSSAPARTLRLLAEYLEPEARFERFNVDDTIVFFGSARARQPPDGAPPRPLDRYYEAAEELAYRLTLWSKGLHKTRRRFIVCSGGGPGIMEAANKGASRARGLSVGLGISLPFEQGINPFVSRELGFEFHYFFMRKFWFVYLARALVVFPGGFGTMDELFELLTLVQTGKASRPRRVVLFGREFWEKVIDWDLLTRWGVIDAEDLSLFRICDSVDEAESYLTGELSALYDLEDGTER
ncbi:MAG: LOG family protein [Acidobacteriota bacterium]|nr:LOG family protein [Acidobacteriota bacterium]MDQ7088061.1 LOG family protein [Acidobacteriota bacterium]